MGCIYKITNPQKRIYVGKTLNLRKRIYNYKNLKSHKDFGIIMKSIRKYGWGSHTIEILEDNISYSNLSEREIFWIRELKSNRFDNPMGMNLTYGGDGGNWKHDEERVKKHILRMSGKNNIFYGKVWTKEEKEAQSKMVSEYNIKNGKKPNKIAIENGLNAVRKKVLAYDRMGSFIKEFPSLTSAAKYFNTKIETVTHSIKMNVLANNKYQFKYKTENYPLTIIVSSKYPNSTKRPVLTLTDTYEIVFEHESAKAASDFWQLSHGAVKNAARNNWLVPTKAGHVFIYKDLYEGILAAEKAA